MSKELVDNVYTRPVSSVTIRRVISPHTDARLPSTVLNFSINGKEKLTGTLYITALTQYIKIFKDKLI